jgi:hypothetical protein
MDNMNLKSKNGNERIVLNLKNGNAIWISNEPSMIRNYKSEIIYDPYSGKIQKIKLVA